MNCSGWPAPAGCGSGIRPPAGVTPDRRRRTGSRTPISCRASTGSAENGDPLRRKQRRRLRAGLRGAAKGGLSRRIGNGSCSPVRVDSGEVGSRNERGHRRGDRPLRRRERRGAGGSAPGTGDGLVDPEPDGSSLWSGPVRHYETSSQCLPQRGTDPRGNPCSICTGSIRGRSFGHPSGRALQPRRHHLRRLPGQLETRSPVPYLGDPYPPRAPGPRLHPERPAPRGTGPGRGARHAGPPRADSPEPGPAERHRPGGAGTSSPATQTPGGFSSSTTKTRFPCLRARSRHRGCSNRGRRRRRSPRSGAS